MKAFLISGVWCFLLFHPRGQARAFCCSILVGRHVLYAVLSSWIDMCFMLFHPVACALPTVIVHVVTVRQTRKKFWEHEKRSSSQSDWSLLPKEKQELQHSGQLPKKAPLFSCKPYSFLGILPENHFVGKGHVPNLLHKPSGFWFYLIKLKLCQQHLQEPPYNLTYQKRKNNEGVFSSL